ncbi:hypothetical protein COV93_03150 [Candidatus Woesearchaeota archaeon CG11_big_fil_rev_8_21_14_0_20_43_8]|nr:MAG: hypothetical protein COV93_03150 [Candidatus Woesearchaeota archaeon CG11_big_fil_rev_8_21_14_0_20_43_8]PIO05149.1 MAG: hypothetical protein COT47_06075 [Candidatus Woesearchaeota archaeon CG08_land_8_20_14_0_20_43_7]
MKKKGDISIQVIVVAILALLVLVILSVMFISKMGKTGDQISGCGSKGGTCKSVCGTDETPLVLGNADCDKQTSGYKCCLPVSG